MATQASLPKLAFLGPLGSHTYQCAQDEFGDNVEYIEKQTIADVFDAVSDEIPYALIPQENSIFGTVTETYNLLRLPEAGQSKFVRGEVTLAVKHCLLVREGVRIEDIRKVLSHEQALGQCAKYLSTQLPDATLVKMPSTSAAAQALLSADNEADAHTSAAICSSLCASIFDGLQILSEGIQDQDVNFTRFYVLSHSLDAVLPTRRVGPTRALVRIYIKPSTEPEEEHSDRLGQLIISTLLTTFGLPVARIDRRPSLGSTPFNDVYFIELEDKKRPQSPQVRARYVLEDIPWMGRLKTGIERVEAAGGEATLLGYW